MALNKLPNGIPTEERARIKLFIREIREKSLASDDKSSCAKTRGGALWEKVLTSVPLDRTAAAVTGTSRPRESKAIPAKRPRLRHL
jgi:hypothetical protein